MKNISLSACQLANQLQLPEPLDGCLASGVFVQVRSNKESAQFLGDLTQILEADGMLVVTINAQHLMVEDGLTCLAQMLRERCGIDCLAVGEMGEPTLADTLANIMHIQPRTLVLLLDGAQRLPAEPGERVLKAIKAARDCVNLQPASNGKLFVIATWILPADPSSYVENTSSAFYGANAVSLAHG